jgi:hypothetical protein
MEGKRHVAARLGQCRSDYELRAQQNFEADSTGTFWTFAAGPAVPARAALEALRATAVPQVDCGVFLSDAAVMVSGESGIGVMGAGRGRRYVRPNRNRCGGIGIGIGMPASRRASIGNCVAAHMCPDQNDLSDLNELTILSRDRAGTGAGAGPRVAGVAVAAGGRLRMC